MRELKRSGMIFKIAYGWTPEENIPSQISLCKLFWRVVWVTPLVWLFLFPLSWLIVSILFVLSFLWNGTRPGVLKGDGHQGFIEIRRWPTLRGLRLSPGLLIIIVALLHFVWRNREKLSSAGGQLFKEFAPGLIFLGYVIGSVCLVVLSSLALSYFSNSEAWRLFKAFLRARKERVCPILKIEAPSGLKE